MLLLLTLFVLVVATIALVAVGIATLAPQGILGTGQGETSVPKPQSEPSAGSDDAVARLMEVNQQIHQQLVTAEEKLDMQARQIESHVVEARTDSLTQVSNRRALDDALARRIEELRQSGAATSVMLLDVDHFKKFNDTYGHQAGDEVLRQVAHILRQQGAAELVARYGGEEFAVIYADALPSARIIAERARAAIGAAAIRFEGRELRVAASGGIAELQSAEDQTALLKRADDALYAAKKGGRNCLYWNDGHMCHRLQPYQKSVAGAPARDNLSELLNLEWTMDGDELPDTVVGPAAVYVSSKPAFIDDMIRRLAQWRRDHTPLCLMLVQMAGFTEGMQKHGEEAAGLALRVVAQILKANMRDMDHVSRLGSDTFALLLPGAQLEDGIRCAERLRQAAGLCRLPAKGNGFPLELTIGLVETFTGDDLRRLLQRGRNALQVAIDRGQEVFAQDVRGTLAATELAEYA